MTKQNCLLLILAAISDFGIKKMYEDFIWKNLPTITFIFSFIQVGQKKSFDVYFQTRDL